MRDPSLADNFVMVMAELARIEDGIDNDHPHRYPIRQLRQAAEKQIDDALRNALRLADLVRVLKKELAERDQ